MARKRRSLLGWNEGRLQVDHNLFEVIADSEDEARVLAASLISTFGVLQAELLGRANLGLGALKTEGVDIKEMMVLRPASLDKHQRDRVGKTFDRIADRQILMIYDEVRRPDRADLDREFLIAAGLSDDGLPTVVHGLQDEACRSVWKRLSKAGNARESRQSYDEWLATGAPFGAGVEEDEGE